MRINNPSINKMGARITMAIVEIRISNSLFISDSSGAHPKLFQRYLSKQHNLPIFAPNLADSWPPQLRGAEKPPAQSQDSRASRLALLLSGEMCGIKSRPTILVGNVQPKPSAPVIALHPSGRYHQNRKVSCAHGIY